MAVRVVRGRVRAAVRVGCRHRRAAEEEEVEDVNGVRHIEAGEIIRVERVEASSIVAARDIGHGTTIVLE